MAEDDWGQVRIPKKMLQAIDQFLDTDVSKKNGVVTRPDFVTRVIAQWFSRFEKEFGMFVPRDVLRNIKGFDLMKPYDPEN